MNTRLVDDPVWHAPTPALAKLAGQRVLIIDNGGKPHAGILLLNISRNRPVQYSVRVINGVKKYLTYEAVEMLEYMSVDPQGPDLLLNFGEHRPEDPTTLFIHSYDPTRPTDG